MDKTIARLNIEHIEQRLEHATDKSEIARLRALLDEERSKLKVVLERETDNQKTA